MLYRNRGLTILELMAVVAISSILAMIAIPSYISYVKNADVANAQKEISKLVTQLERHKSRNFTYKGFDAYYLYSTNNFDQPTQKVYFPLDKPRTQSKYIIVISDPSVSDTLISNNSSGQSWAIKAVSQDPSNFSLLMTSSGVQCKNKTANNIDSLSCGVGSESW